MFVFYSNMLPKIDFTNYERCYPKRLKNFFRTNINYKTPLREKMSNAIEYYKSLPDWYWTKTSENIPICMIW